MKLLVAGEAGFSGEQLKILEDKGFAVTVQPDEQMPCAFDVSDFEAVIGSHIFEATPLSAFKSLKILQTTTAGLDYLPLEELAARGVRLYNARGVYSAPMAEFLLGCVLQLYKNLDGYRISQRAHLWEKDRDLRELGGQTVCIVGAGSIGAACAKRFAAMDCRVTGLCRHPEIKPFFDEVLPMERLGETLGRSDIVLLTIPLTEATRGLFGRAQFAAMKTGALFCNIARGGLTDTAALVDALQSGKLCGAVLDVTDPEPLPAASPLWDMDNVVLTPHISYAGENNINRMFAVALRNLEGEIGR